MKPDVHPAYGSAVGRVHVSCSSHPFCHGTQRVLDTARRVQRFKQRFGERAG